MDYAFDTLYLYNSETGLVTEEKKFRTNINVNLTQEFGDKEESNNYLSHNY